MAMSVTGTVKNGVVVLPPGTNFPEGAAVRVETLQLSGEDDPLVAAVDRLDFVTLYRALLNHPRIRVFLPTHTSSGVAWTCLSRDPTRSGH